MVRATVTSKGQITIPKKIRDRLGLSAGDGLEFIVDAEGNLVGKPLRKSGAGELAGCLRHLAHEAPVTLAEMDEAIRRSALERNVRVTTGERDRGRATDSGRRGSEKGPSA